MMALGPLPSLYSTNRLQGTVRKFQANCVPGEAPFLANLLNHHACLLWTRRRMMDRGLRYDSYEIYVLRRHIPCVVSLDLCPVLWLEWCLYWIVFTYMG